MAKDSHSEAGQDVGEWKEVVSKGYPPDLPAHQSVLSAGHLSQTEKVPKLFETILLPYFDFAPLAYSGSSLPQRYPELHG